MGSGSIQRRGIPVRQPVLAIGKGTLAPEIETGTIEPSPGSRLFAIKRQRPERAERQLVYVPNWLDEL